MKNYVTTKENPIFKEGIKFKSESHSYISIRFSRNQDVKELEISTLLEKGYIKEVEDKQFTKSDIEDFLSYYFNADFDSALLNAINHSFYCWLKQRNQ